MRSIIQSVTTAAIGLIRLIYNAIYSPAGWGWDDYNLLVALFAGAPAVVIIDRMAIPNGLGQDVWTVPLNKIITFVQSIYVLEIFYFLDLVLVKQTLLLFFLRIFPKQTIKRLIKLTLIFNALYGFVFIVIAIFPCQPISYYWTRFQGRTTGQCIDISSFIWANAGISITLDVWMLALPLYEVFQLRMSWTQRFSVALMFFVGTL